MNAILADKEQLPETPSISKNEREFKEEYKHFLQKYPFPLLDDYQVRIDEVGVDEVDAIKKPKTSVIEQKDDTIFFCIRKKCYFKTAATLHLQQDTDNMALAKNIVQSFLMHSSYAYGSDFKQQNSYTTTVAKEKAWKMAIQEGIARWIFGSSLMM